MPTVTLCKILAIYTMDGTWYCGLQVDLFGINLSNNLLVAKCLKLSPGDQPICCLVKEGSKKRYLAQIH